MRHVATTTVHTWQLKTVDAEKPRDAPVYLHTMHHIHRALLPNDVVRDARVLRIQGRTRWEYLYAFE